MNKKDLISLRDALESDRAFIMSSWLQGMRYGNSFYREIDHEAFYHYFRKWIEKILERNISLRIACLKEDPDVNLGFSAFEEKMLHYVFIKPAWRGIGILDDLLPKEIDRVTTLSSVGKALLTKRFPNAIFNPFIEGGDYV